MTWKFLTPAVIRKIVIGTIVAAFGALAAFTVNKVAEHIFAPTRQEIVRDNATAPGTQPVPDRPATQAIPLGPEPRQQTSGADRDPQLIPYVPGMKVFNGTGAPLVWYYKGPTGVIELFDASGHHTGNGEKLLPITREVVDELRNLAEEAAKVRSRVAVSKILGFEFANMSEELIKQYSIGKRERGVIITGVDADSDASKKGLSPGDVIVEVSQMEVSNVENLQSNIQKLKSNGRKSVLLLVASPNAELRFVALPLDAVATASKQSQTGISTSPPRLPSAATDSANDYCPSSIDARRNEIAKIAVAQSRDYEYGTLVLESLQCGSFRKAMDVAARMTIAQERDGAHTLIVMSALSSSKHDIASQALEKIVIFQTKERLRTILIAELGRKREGGWGATKGYDPNDPDIVSLSYGTLGGARYNYRTGAIIDEWSPCGRGRADCGPNSYADDDPVDYSEPIK